MAVTDIGQSSFAVLYKCMFVPCAAVVATEVETANTSVENPHQGVEHRFGDTFISLPGEIFTSRADNESGMFSTIMVYTVLSIYLRR